MISSLDRLDVRTWIEINARFLGSNLAWFQRRARPAGIMAVVKSNAYGHGLSLVAKLLAESKKRTGHWSLVTGHSLLWFGVDSITEALRLRRDGIKNPILVLGYTLPAHFPDAVRGGITLAISSCDGLAALRRARVKPAFHLKFDTGMHRHGFQEHELGKLIEKIQEYRLIPGGAFSHLAAADNVGFSKKQIAVFERCLEALTKAGIKPKVIHFNKTEGILSYPRRDTLARLGIGLYGYVPKQGVGLPKTPKNVVRPVLAWKTVVSEVKRVRKGERIGYDLTYRFPRDAVIAVLPIGYWHGFDRGLSNRGEVLIRGRRAPVRGRICMDITMVEVTHIPGVRVGDEVVLIGKQGGERITADDIAKKIDTTSYEVLTRINPLIKKSGVLGESPRLK
ncbi:alanine racemase [Candidatus Kaiserbacteria bacterium RIFCSPLOWO2_01_FULL_53_17]|uniref:Alanine racemase n=1 Tax=Candidatus Kaiserbacteria bacterium RIFCSPLOWO2_01_FULL_53_17 TaxID=1798511 RepID=A0A1F6EIC1_9BACT|nr:MAG: alanine racemase [Candidatus Kaiserbacteria bacterium RIFCSPLOWO2_01_FULL_53_17]